MELFLLKIFNFANIELIANISAFVIFFLFLIFSSLFAFNTYKFLKIKKNHEYRNLSLLIVIIFSLVLGLIFSFVSMILTVVRMKERDYDSDKTVVLIFGILTTVCLTVFLILLNFFVPDVFIKIDEEYIYFFSDFKIPKFAFKKLEITAFGAKLFFIRDYLSKNISKTISFVNVKNNEFAKEKTFSDNKAKESNLDVKTDENDDLIFYKKKEESLSADVDKAAKDLKTHLGKNSNKEKELLCIRLFTKKAIEFLKSELKDNIEIVDLVKIER